MRRNRWRAGAWHAVVVVPALAAAATSHADPRLTLDAAIDSAWARYPSLAVATARRDAAWAAAGVAGADRWPSLHLSGSVTQYQEPTLVTPIHAFVPSQLPPFDTTIFQGTLTANWLLLDGGGREGRLDAARQRADGADADQEATRQHVASRVVDAYLLVLTARQVLDAQDLRLAALDAEVARVRQRLDVGRAAQVELLRAQATHASAEAERVRLVAMLDVAERDLARLVGAAPETTRAARLIPVALADTTLPDRAALLATALQASPALRRARSETQATAAVARQARSTRWPELEAVGNYLGWSNGADADALEWNAGLRVGLPIFTGGAISNAIERADAQRRAATREMQVAELQLESDLDQALARAAQARARVVSLSTAVDRFAEVVRIEKLALGAGSGTQTDYLNAEADLLESRAGLAEARSSETIARVALARVSGTLDRAWIARTLESRP